MSNRARVWLAVAILLIGTIVGAVFFRISLPHIQLPAEEITRVGGFPITNTLIASWLAIVLLVVLFRLATRSMGLVPGRGQNLAELVIESLMGLVEGLAGARKGRLFFPLVATIFLFVLANNWMGLLPGYTTIGIWHDPAAAHAKADDHGATSTTKDDNAGKKKADDHAAAAPHGPILVPLLRSANTDLNTTVALALVSVIMTQVFGVRLLGIGEYAGKFFNFKGGPLGLFIGLLELVGEVARILSFSFRLFGNIFAGEVLLGVIGFLAPWVVILPFLGLEIFVGFIQALVFAMLTLVFMTLATTSHHEGDHGDAHHEAHH